MIIKSTLIYTGQKFRSGFSTNDKTHQMEKWNVLDCWFLDDNGEAITGALRLPKGEMPEPAAVAQPMTECIVDIIGLATERGVCKLTLAAVLAVGEAGKGKLGRKAGKP